MPTKRRPLIPNVPLKTAIFASGKRQSDIARSARIRETQFSHYVTGRKHPTEKEQARIAKALRVPVETIFADPLDTPEAPPLRTEARA